MSFDYNKLKGRIKEYYGTQIRFAKKINLSNTSLSKKLNNKIDFTQEEIECSIKALKLTKEDIPVYFFVNLVQKAKPRRC